MRTLEERVRELYTHNRRTKDNFQYTVPSPKSYPYQWLWDSCFHAIVLSHFSLEDAKKELRSLVAHQLPNGLIPHVTYWDDNDILKINWGTQNTSAITQPPLIAYATLRVFSCDNDRALLEDMYPALARYYRYLLTRDSRQHHLVGIINPDESGEDNSPRFDEALSLPSRHDWKENNAKRFKLFDRNRECNFEAERCMRNFFWVKDVPFNAYMIENLEALSEIAQILEKEDESAFFKQQAHLMRDAMRIFMHEDGVFWTICGPDHQKVYIRTWALFAPLIGRIATEEEAKQLVQKYLRDKKQFWSKYPLPTVALDEASFQPEEPTTGQPWERPNWRGPIWMAPNWFVYRGLKNYGFDEEAEHIKKMSRKLITASGFREYFHPKTGAGMGADNFTWGGLVIDMN
jgi:neutral trehalase